MSTLAKAIIEQLDSPVSFDYKGQQVTLRDFLKDKSKESLSISSLTPKQRVELTVERIKREPEVTIATIGSGVITKERAIAEIQSQTPIGQILIEAEQRLINRLIKEAESGRLKGIIND
ncbi:MAG: hypothetical protein RMY64_06790 [Nostoc sp. DedQUE08]|uniref:hypothetical protein n=1 Tax=Nostoc sp. DedQUE08 TaxID=3075393 RepID=UPI002AD2DB76|nr:hypothetical protein [Nostoc sp. DedQUE08]MDZ8065333.1 hypothetical protein [Nostoc sp. DedQUE08]